VWSLVGAYLAIVLAGLMCVLCGRGTTLLRGERVFGLTVAFAGAALTALAMSWVPPARAGVIFWVVSLACSLLVGKSWILLRYDPATTAAVLEGSMTMLLIPFERAGPRYALRVGDGSALMTVRQLFAPVAILTVPPVGGRKKLALLRALLAKRFRPVFPRPTIDLR
jgi:hypothetical protein